MIMASFKDFEEYQALHNYEDFHGDCSRRKEVVSKSDGEVGGGDIFVEGGPSTTSHEDCDIVLKALTLAGARTCDDCKAPFTECNGPEVFCGCGHMVCKACYLSCCDLNKGNCVQCYKASEGLPIPSTSTSMSIRSLVQNELVEKVESTPMFSPPPSPSVPQLQDERNGGVGKEPAETEKTLPKPMIIRSPEKVILSFPNPVQFIMNQEEPVTPGSPDKGIFRYSITADSVAVKVEQDTPTSMALNFLKDVQIKAAIASSCGDTDKPSNRNQQSIQKFKKVVKVESANVDQDVPTVFAGAPGQIKRGVKRQAQQTPSPPKTSLQNSPNHESIEAQQMLMPPQQKRRVVLLPNISELYRLNLIVKKN